MNVSLNVLLVEDSEDDALLVLRELRRGGFNVVWERVETAEALCAALLNSPWDIVISDYRLPRLSGPAALEIVKQSQPNLPFIVVSGTIGEVLAVDLMKAGAHDYLMKDNLVRLSEAVRREVRDAQSRTERQQATLELDQTKERLQFAIEGSGIGLWDWSVQTLDMTINDRWAEIFGYSISELEPINIETWWQNTHPEDLPVLTLALEQHFQKEIEVYECEMRMRHKLGGWVWVLCKGKVVEWDATGKPLRMIGTHLDITSRKQTAEMLLKLNENLENRVQKRTAALQQSEARLREAQQIAHLGSWEFDVESRKISWSAEVFNIFRLDPILPEPTYEQLLRDFFPDEQVRLNQLVDRAIRCGETYSTDLKIMRADGSSGYIFNKAELLYNSAGQATRLFGIVMDISDRKFIQEALQSSEERARATLLALPDLVFRVNSDGQYMDFLTSPPGKNLVDPDKMIGKSIYEALPADIIPNQAEAKYSALRQALATQSVQIYEQQVWIEGKLRHEEVRVAPCGDDEVVFFVRDISDRKQTEKALRESRQFIQTVIDTIPLPLFWKNRESVYLGCNHQFAKTLGFATTTEVIGKTDFDLSATEAEAISYRADDKRVMESGEAKLGFQETLTLPNGELRWLETHKAPLQDWSNNAIGVVVMFQDITERKQAEVQLQQTNNELSRATRLKDEFLANMSHELRTPLNAILGMTEGLQEEVFGDINEKQRKALQTTEHSATHLLELINDILDVAKIESGQMELNYTPTSINHLCQSSLAFIKQQAFKKRIQLIVNLAPNLREIDLDERRIRQVLINLLNNAVKFTPTGGRITLEVRYEPIELNLADRISLSRTTNLSEQPPANSTPLADRWYLCISVIDTGIGIAPADQDKLFQAFVQIDSRLNRQYEGTGLGLSLVKQIVELHGGDVSLRSQIGQGSCFTIRLPYVSAPENRTTPALFLSPDRVQTPEAIATVSEPNSELGIVDHPLILIADDNEANISTVSSYLKAKGYRILLAKDGQEAIDIAKTHQPDLILMDIQMPVMDGLEATRQIRLDPNLVDVPIIALTALAMPGDREKCLEVGANDYIAKPVKLRDLSTKIQILLKSFR